MSKRVKVIISTILSISIIMLSACSSSNSNINTAKSIIDNELSDDVDINKCMFNEKSNVLYVIFYSFEHGNDDAFILLDNNKIYYGGVYSTIEDDDYDKQIEYGDYAIWSYQISSGDEDWVEINDNQ